MGIIADALNEWLNPILREGILDNIQGVFDSVNGKVTEISSLAGQTPQGWNLGVFALVKNISDTVILPIAGMILSAVMAMEMIQMILERNNAQETDTWMIFRWILRTTFAVFLVSNSWKIVMGFFDVGKYVVDKAAGIIHGSLTIDVAEKIDTISLTLQSASLGKLFGIYLLTIAAKLSGAVIAIFVFIVIVGRIVEIYMVSSVAPLTLATTMNRSWGNIGQNYIRLLLSLAFQGLLIMIAVAIYVQVIQEIPDDFSDVSSWLLTVLGYTALLCFSLSKTGGLSKSLFGAH